MGGGVGSRPTDRAWAETAETLSELFLEFFVEYGWDPPSPIIQGICWKKGKTPTPKTRVSIWTLPRTPGRFTTRPLPVYSTTKMSVVRPFSVLSKDEIGL